MTNEPFARIGLDARMVLHSGIGTYIRGILKPLLAAKDLDFTLFGPTDKIASYNCRKVLADWPIYSLREQIFFPGLARRESLDLLHVPHYNAPLGLRGKLVVTVHDLIHLKFPPSWPAYLYARTVLQTVMRKAAAIIAVSHHTKRDLVEWLGVSEQKIHVIHNGVSEDAKPGPSSHDQPFLLYIGNLKPHKNVGLLLEAFDAARVRSPDLRLVLVGKSWLPDLLHRYAGRPEIRFAGELSYPQILELYRGARALVFPSLYEGFGLPPLEAMASGCPVICSNAASLPEVTGDAAVTLDPKSVRAWADAITRVWSDADLRKDLSVKGLEQAKKFSWDRCAAETAALYRALA